MNQHLQNILNFIRLDKNLSDEEKNSLTKSLDIANKELELTAFKLDRTEKIKRTTAILLEETIEELERKQKAVELQNRELEIEASLERVRSKTMAMHNSQDVGETVVTLFDELIKLGIDELERCGIGIMHEPYIMEAWTAAKTNEAKAE